MTRTTRNGLIAAGVVVLIAGLLGLGWLLGSDDGATGEDPATGSETTASETTSAASPETEVRAARVDEFGLGVGDPDAPVKVEIFEDFQCPHCQAFEAASSDDLMAAAGDGSAYVVYRPMAFLNEWSERALNAFGVVMEVADGETALEFHDLLFANQPAGAAPTDEEIVALAVQAGAPEDEVRAGVETGSFVDWAADATAAAAQQGVTGTPTVFVDGEVVPGASIAELLENTMTGIAAG